MNRVITNFGPYEDEYRSRVPPIRRLASVVLHATAIVIAVALAALFVFPVSAHAGRPCDPAKPTTSAVARSMELAQRTGEALDTSGARVVLLARAGQDLSKYGLRYSHLGIAYKSERGQWRVVHKLNACGTSVAAVYRQGLGEFFLDGLWRYEAAWVVPSPAVQARLQSLLDESPQSIVRLSTSPYSIVSYAWGQKYQQSNQWALETLAGAMEPTTIATREQAQAWLRFKGYQPTTLHLGPLQRLGGRIGSANVAFDDHPSDKRFTDRIETVTVESIFDWLPRAGLGSPPERFDLSSRMRPQDSSSSIKEEKT
ncbi:MAG: DUF2145 domain-containing protein [Gammaproteobacteria bacterium]|nr:DUF2145 domain-containing protein [Gammaproteobacteria bacterium]MBU1442226.1 DUF2145 domain-containing protein [Gammaproteobacteria bacterium]MBU2287987.1 DUF2145 domain-containing protein [Gammaproteobacteria bacterium]MBU2409258.1 DUF2145 domain-containing protein [Gammaproteobacteria bacterium]